MRTRILLVALAVAVPTFAQSNYFAEAGVGYAGLSGARFPTGQILPLADVDADDGAWAPYLAAGYDFSERFALRASYTYLDGADATVTYRGNEGSTQYFLTNRYEGRGHLLSLAPEFKWRVTPAVVFSVAPELNWLYLRESIATDTNMPHILVMADRVRSEEDLSLGGTASLQWAWSPAWTLAVRYRFVDLDPSWNRKAHVLSGGVIWRF